MEEEIKKCLLFRRGWLSGAEMAVARNGGQTVLRQRELHKQRPRSRLMPGGAADVHAAPRTLGRGPRWRRGECLRVYTRAFPSTETQRVVKAG